MSELNGHIPEHELLEFIEGTLSAAREAVVSAALGRDPRLAKLVSALRADRRTLVEFGDVHAPAELSERIEGILERQALLGLTDLSGAAGQGALPISRLRPSRPSVVVRAWRSPATRGLAVAAAIAMVAGGGFWTVTLLRRQAPATLGPDSGTPIASGGAEPAAEPAPVVEPGGDSALAAAEPVGPDPAEIASAAPGSGDLAAMGAAVGSAVSDAAAAIAAAPAAREDAITPARAVELARRGRLAIVVETGDTEGAVARAEALAKGSGGGRGASWRRIDGGLAGGAMAPGYETVAALWSPHFAPTHDLPAPAVPGGPGGPVTVADGGAHAPAIGPGVRLPLRFPRWSGAMEPPAAAYAVSVEDRESVLVSLVAALRMGSTSGQGGRGARFIELPVAIDPMPASDPDAVLWWANAPSEWTWRVTVPVLIGGGGVLE